MIITYVCYPNKKCKRVADGGGTMALQADPQGKTYASALLRMEVEADLL
jgi:hypothetical protein